MRADSLRGLAICLGVLGAMLWGQSGICACCDFCDKSLADGTKANGIACLTRQLDDLEGRARIEALVRRGEAYRRLGHYTDAATDFQSALHAARADEEPVLAIVASGSWGYVNFLRSESSSAETLLRSALADAKALNRPDLVASCANRLGQVLAAQNLDMEARALFQTAIRQAKLLNDPGMEAAGYCNMAGVLTDDDNAMAALAASRKATDRIADTKERIELLIAVASEAKTRVRKGRKALAAAYDALSVAYALAGEEPAFPEAETKETHRLRSMVFGEFGALYEDDGRIEEALDLTEAALSSAQLLRAQDLLIRWDWQLGRLLKKKGDLGTAIAAYRRAVGHIENIRQDLPLQYQNGKSSFRETLAPIYFELADLLLWQHTRETDDDARQSLLREARDTVEKLKRSELQDYFQDRCVASLSQNIESLSSATAVLYPISFDDRLVLLVDIRGRLYAVTVRATKADVDTAANLLAHRFRTMSEYEKPAMQLYDWLIRPIRGLLEEHHTDTVVFAPDGALRLLPAAGLWDGSQFLVEQYAVVCTPGLTLLSTKPIARGNMAALLAGMSTPGPVVDELPETIWKAFVAFSNSPAGNVRGLSVVADRHTGTPSTDAPRTGRPEKNRVKAALALPGVEREIHELSGLLNGKAVLNEDFRLERFGSEVKDHFYSIIHIASHGYFGGTPDQNFIMTYDRLMTMQTLENMVKPRQFAARPVEIIALSACQTAEGDDRSPLGLTGVALKSGARSALGTLWPVSDVAAQALFPAFYQQLKTTSKTKAEALREAQLQLLHQSEFRHPFFWSPFILVGNWL